MIREIYGEGGFDQSLPNNNVIATEEIPDVAVPMSDSEKLQVLLNAIATANVDDNLKQVAADLSGN